MEIADGAIRSRELIHNPGHEPCFLPGYLAQRGVTCIVAGGMGPRAQMLFDQHGIETIVGISGNIEETLQISEALEILDRPYLFGRHTYNRARIASLLGEKQQAVDLLHQAMREGLGFGIYVIQDQDFLPIKDFPPFQEFIKPKG